MSQVSYGIIRFVCIVQVPASFIWIIFPHKTDERSASFKWLPAPSLVCFVSCQFPLKSCCVFCFVFYSIMGTDKSQEQLLLFYPAMFLCFILWLMFWILCAVSIIIVIIITQVQLWLLWFYFLGFAHLCFLCAFLSCFSGLYFLSPQSLSFHV